MWHAGLDHARRANDFSTLSPSRLLLLHINFPLRRVTLNFCSPFGYQYYEQFSYNYYYLVLYAPAQNIYVHTPTTIILLCDRVIYVTIYSLPTYTILCTNLLYVTTGRRGVYTPPACICMCIISCLDVNPRGVA